MAVEILPAILAHNLRELRQEIATLKPLSRSFHVDIMDGVFVSGRTVSKGHLLQRLRSMKIDLHLMVQRPSQWVDFCCALRPRRVFLHIENTPQELLPTVAALRSCGIQAGLAISPGTPLRRLTEHRHWCRHVLVMTVRPGQYHAPAIVGAGSRIRAVARALPAARIICDGHVTERTLPLWKQAGAQAFIVGSAVVQAAHPAAELQRLRRVARS